MLKLEFHAMGCEMLVASENESDQAEQRLNAVPRQFAEWEQALSRFKPASDLNWLNDRSGSWVPVSAVMWEVLQAAMVAWEQSHGLVTPTILPALESAGYRGSFESVVDGGIDAGRRIEGRAEDAVDIRFDHATRSVFMPVGMRVDLGGVAKGWAANQAMNQLGDLGPILLDCGGDIAISSPLSGEKPWAIGVNDPFNRGSQIETLHVRKGGVATSGIDHRRWKQGNEWRHHLIDPRTGLPAQTDLVSVTVIAETVMLAEMAAKTVLILGSQAGLDWLDQQDYGSALAILENGELLGSQGIEAYIRN